MAVTPMGTTYTIRTGTQSDGGTYAWYVDNTRLGDAGIPLLVYAHGAGSSHLAFHSSTFTILREWLMDNGWAVVESDGGGYHSWGNQAARDAYVEAFNVVDSTIDVGDVTVMGGSMGGIVTYWLATQSPFAARVSTAILHQAATDLTYRYDVKRGLAEMNAAYGIEGGGHHPEEFAVASAGHDPMQFEAELWAGKHVLQVWGTADTAVVWEFNGQAWINKYGANAASVTVRAVEGQGHGTGSTALIHIVDYLAGKDEGETPQEPVGFHRIKGLYVVDNGRQLYPVEYGSLA